MKTKAAPNVSRKTYRKSKLYNYGRLEFYCTQTFPSFLIITNSEFHITDASQPEGVKTISGGQGTPSTGLSIRFSALRDSVYRLFLKK